ncbi:hypothetical protein C8F04DRAFT_1279308 [Mycena alexandri]|uniref:Uncharacterized protein n=1 Tax=Mycena alexandri TaxID=1745969 RepID=A0AAD6S227_9AGAR|nr:hypothetical protein C8F04DRAFT_1279308 [Mycena alexandri]
MNLSHVITEFSFGPFFPDITQPLDNSFELTTERWGRILHSASERVDVRLVQLEVRLFANLEMDRWMVVDGGGTSCARVPLIFS